MYLYNINTNTEFSTEEQAYAAYQNHRANREQVCIVDQDYNEVFCNRWDH